MYISIHNLYIKTTPCLQKTFVQKKTLDRLFGSIKTIINYAPIYKKLHPFCIFMKVAMLYLRPTLISLKQSKPMMYISMYERK